MSVSFERLWLGTGRRQKTISYDLGYAAPVTSLKLPDPRVIDMFNLWTWIL